MSEPTCFLHPDRTPIRMIPRDPHRLDGVRVWVCADCEHARGAQHGEGANAKKRYPTEQTGQIACDRLEARLTETSEGRVTLARYHFAVYPCPWCEGWHIGKFDPTRRKVRTGRPRGNKSTRNAKGQRRKARNRRVNAGVLPWVVLAPTGQVWDRAATREEAIERALPGYQIDRDLALRDMPATG